MRILGAHGFKGLQQNLFFAGMGGASHNNGIMVLQAQLITIFCQILGSYLGIGLVKFSVTGYKNLLSIGTQMGNIIGINAGLHAKACHSVQHIIPNAVKIAIILNGFFADTTVNHHYRDMAFTDGTQKVGPQLRFYGHKHARVNAFY